MATGARVKIEGLSELKVQLDRLRRSTGRAALERAALSAMEPMARLARSLAPHDTYELMESIEVGFAAKTEDPGLRAYADTLSAGGSKAEAVAATRDARRAMSKARGLYVDVFMGPKADRHPDPKEAKQLIIKGYMMEFGTATREPHPYMRPAFERDHQAMLERLREDIRFEVFAAIGKSQARGTLEG